MDKIDKAAHDLMMRAYKMGGRIPFHSIDRYGLTKSEISKLNDILIRYGELEGKLFEAWEWYQLNDKGVAFVESGGFKAEKNKGNKSKEERMIRIIEIVIIILTFLLAIFQFVGERKQSAKENKQTIENLPI